MPDSWLFESWLKLRYEYGCNGTSWFGSVHGLNFTHESYVRSCTNTCTGDDENYYGVERRTAGSGMRRSEFSTDTKFGTVDPDLLLIIYEPYTKFSS